MHRIVIAVFIGALGAAAVGAVVSGLFWLTVLALAVVLLAGAVGLTLLPPAAEDEAPRGTRTAVLVQIHAGRSLGRGRGQDGGHGLRGAA
jgi:hypothetical protein